jgi:hypothetical protein
MLKSSLVKLVTGLPLYSTRTGTSTLMMITSSLMGSCSWDGRAIKEDEKVFTMLREMNKKQK